MNNLLEDRLFTVATASTRLTVCLPELFVLLARDQVQDFPLLRPHQAPAWHILLVQLATLALRQTGGSEPPDSAEEWAGLLRALTPDYADDTPWCLVVDDWLKPAFLQPPCRLLGDRADYKRVSATPDALDVLICAKNHDQKSERMVDAQAEQWLYALVTLQTTEGFLGAGNYGIARMNGGFASRPMLRCAPLGLGPGGQVFRDVSALLSLPQRLAELAESTGVGHADGAFALLWLQPWDGETSIPLNRLDIIGVEICRRVRLVSGVEGITACSAPSSCARVDAKIAKGVVGDPWIPIDREETKAFTITAEGFTYWRIAQLLDGAQFARPLLAEPTRAERRSGASLVLHAAALARGKGKTEGFHTRAILLPPAAAALFANNDIRFTHRSTAMVELAAAVSGKALRSALIQLLQGKQEPDWKKPSNTPLTAPWLARFDSLVDACFFGQLSTALTDALEDHEADARWSRSLHTMASDVFAAACESAPRSESRRYLAQARAANLLRNALHKQLPALRPVE